MKFGFVARHRGIWPIAFACEALGFSRSGFYAWYRRPRSRRACTDAQILATIRASFVMSDATYGVRRMLDEVRAAGHRCGRDRVGRLMRGAALRERPRRRARCTFPHADGHRRHHPPPQAPSRARGIPRLKARRATVTLRSRTNRTASTLNSRVNFRRARI